MTKENRKQFCVIVNELIELWFIIFRLNSEIGGTKKKKKKKKKKKGNEIWRWTGGNGGGGGGKKERDFSWTITYQKLSNKNIIK